MATLTDDDLQNLAQERDCGPRFVYHIDPVSGDDNANPGKSWQSPIATFNKAITLAAANFANKPVSFWFNGPYNAGTGIIDLQTASLGPVKMKGFGRYASITGSVPNAPIIWAGTACEFDDFQIISGAGANVFNYLIGDATSSVQDVVMRRLRMKGTTDGTYFTGTTSQYTVIECIIDSQWDTFYAQNGSVGRFIRCFHNSLGPHQISSDAHVQGAGQCSGSFVYLIDNTITFRATNSDTARLAYGIHAFNGGLVEFHGTCSVMCEVPDGTVVDLKTDSVSEIKVSSNSSFNLARSLAGSTGTLTQYLAYGDTCQWLGRTPNALSTLGNIPADMVENGGGFTPALNTVNGSVPSGSLPALNGQTITGATNYRFDQPITVNGLNATSWTKLVFTVKANPSDSDSAAVLTIQLSNPGSGGDGLTILNGAAPVSPVTAADGAIVVNQANSSGLVCTVTLTARGMGIAEGTYFWELTPYISGAKASWLGTGQFSVGPTVRQAAT